MTTFNLMAFCNSCMARENANSTAFPGDWASRNKANEVVRAEFKETVSAHFGFGNLPQSVKDKVFQMAWDSGHSAGYYCVADNMEDLFDLVSVVQASTVEA